MPQRLPTRKTNEANQKTLTTGVLCMEMPCGVVAPSKRHFRGVSLTSEIKGWCKMKRTKALIMVLAGVLSFSALAALAEESGHTARALRLARRVTGNGEVVNSVLLKKNTNFDGVWSGQYRYTARGSTCSTRLTRFNFEQLFITNGSRGLLSTNHDGDFNGRSRDKGRRWEFVKSVSVGGRPAVLAIVYGNLAKNGQSAATGIAISISGGCRIVWEASARRIV